MPQQQLDEVRRFQESIRTIKEMFTRDKMKVVFFGRTSNGKSTVINAMLHAKILPQGMGHTTSCFLQVEGGSENEKTFIVEGTEKKMPLEELVNVGDALTLTGADTQKSCHDTLVRIFYPKSVSKLLQNEVVLVDSPGVDLKPEFDAWIDKHCLDADLFVLVANSESTLTQAEKSFFIRVSKKLSKPNVFILNNRWDASAGDQQAEKVKLGEGLIRKLGNIRIVRHFIILQILGSSATRKEIPRISRRVKRMQKRRRSQTSHFLHIGSRSVGKASKAIPAVSIRRLGTSGTEL